MVKKSETVLLFTGKKPEEADSPLMKQLAKKGEKYILMDEKNLCTDFLKKNTEEDFIYLLDINCKTNIGKKIDSISGIFSNKDIHIAGGPAVMPGSGPLREEIFYDILSSKFISGAAANRFRSRSEEDESNRIFYTKNMAVKREVMDRVVANMDLSTPAKRESFLNYSQKKGFNIFRSYRMEIELPLKMSYSTFLKKTFISGIERMNAIKTVFRFSSPLRGFFMLFLPLMIFSLLFSPAEYIFDFYLIYTILFSMLLSHWSFYTFFHYLIFIPLYHSALSLGILSGIFIKKNKSLKE